MSGIVLSYAFTWAALLVFVLTVVVRFIKIQKMPLHVRWELYPVAHESGDKPKYGGSRFEEVNWWEKPLVQSRINELKVMIPEMLFLVALFENNRKLWVRSFAFHFGIYSLIGAFSLVVLAAGCQMFGGEAIGSQSEGIHGLIYSLTKGLSWFGLVLTTIGVFGLLHKRLLDPDYKNYTSGADIFNLLAFLVVAAIFWNNLLFVDPDLVMARSYINGLLTMNTEVAATSGWVFLEVTLLAALVAYIPMTHMSHFFLKWFTYHSIRWDDAPNSAGSAIEKKISKQLNYPVSWAAPHIKGDGKKTWAEVATEEIK